MKSAICLLLLAAIVALGTEAKQRPEQPAFTHFWGVRLPFDRPLYTAILIEQPRFWRVITKEFLWVQKPHPTFTITQVLVRDMTRGTSGASVRLLDGGPNYPYCKFLFQSRRGGRYHFEVLIYGR